MKLITETNFQNIDYKKRIDEETGEKQWIIEGCFAQAETPNRNGRVYPKEILEREVDKYINEQVLKNRALGELEHPKYIQPKPSMASHRIIELNKKGNDYVGKALVLNTPQGQVVKGLLEGGTQLGVSTRGAGSLQESKTYKGIQEVKSDYMLSCVDIVTDPSGIDCFVNGIYEGAEFVWEGEKLVQIAAERSLEKVNENKLIEAFEIYFNTLKKG